MKRTAPEYYRTLEDLEQHLPCPECGSKNVSQWDYKTAMGEQGIVYRDYMICTECLHVWQWVTPSRLFSSAEKDQS